MRVRHFVEVQQERRRAWAGRERQRWQDVSGFRGRGGGGGAGHAEEPLTTGRVGGEGWARRAGMSCHVPVQDV